MRANPRLSQSLAGSLALSAFTLLFGCVGSMEGTGDPNGGGSRPGGGSSGDDVGDSTEESDEPIDVIDCPDGQGPLYELSADLSTEGSDPTRFSSGIRAGSGGAPMTVTCGTTTCGAGQVGVEVENNPFFDRGEAINLEDPFAVTTSILCVEAPPACDGGTSPFYVDSVPDPEDSTQMTGGFWTCSQPCDVVVDFGGLYGFQSACAEAPPSCTGGDAATFTFESQAWECGPMCDGGLYDPVDYGGVTVCVPC